MRFVMVASQSARVFVALSLALGRQPNRLVLSVLPVVELMRLSSPTVFVSYVINAFYGARVFVVRSRLLLKSTLE